MLMSVDLSACDAPGQSEEPCPKTTHHDVQHQLWAYVVKGIQRGQLLNRGVE